MAHFRPPEDEEETLIYIIAPWCSQAEMTRYRYLQSALD